MTGIEGLHARRQDMTADCGSCDDARDREAGVRNSGGHRPRRLASGNDRTRRDTFQHSARKRTGDESYRIRSVNRRAQNVVEIGSKSLKGTAQ
jgi:hypothetical protein